MMEGMPLAPRSRPLVGRDSELERLRRVGCVTDPDLGGGVLVSGDAGIGKSRLVAELAATAEDAGRSRGSRGCSPPTRDPRRPEHP